MTTDKPQIATVEDFIIIKNFLETQREKLHCKFRGYGPLRDDLWRLHGLRISLDKLQRLCVVLGIQSRLEYLRQEREKAKKEAKLKAVSTQPKLFKDAELSMIDEMGKTLMEHRREIEELQEDNADIKRLLVKMNQK